AEGLRRLETRGVAAHPDVHLLAIVDDPGKVSRRQQGIEPAVESRLLARTEVTKHFLHAHDPLTVLVEPEPRRNPGDGAVGTDHEPRTQPLGPSAGFHGGGRAVAVRLEGDDPDRRSPPDSRLQTGLQTTLVE